MRKILICGLVLWLTKSSIAQTQGKHSREEPKNDTLITIYDDDGDSTVYTAMKRILTAVHPISYVAPFMYFKPQERPVPLRFGEGQNGYILEGWIDLDFTLLQGRSQMDHFSQTSRVAFRYAPAVRMTKDNSSNLLPTNQKVGIQIDKVLWDSYTRNFFSDRRHNRFEYADSTRWLRENHPLHQLHATFNALHYSNGQPEGVYASPEDSLIGRNDYIKGDFSTNILNFSLVYSYYNIYLLSASLGYQRDSHWGGPFQYIEEQRGRYGMDRLIGFFQYRSKPTGNPLRRSIVVKDIYHNRNYRVKLLWEHRIRFDFEYILDNLDRFNRSKNYRFSGHLFYEMNPLRSRTTGFIVHLFYGRDYMNIRYDDVIFTAMFGVSFSLKKYRHPRFNPNQYVIKEETEARFEKIREEQKQNQIKKQDRL